LAEPNEGIFDVEQQIALGGRKRGAESQGKVFRDAHIREDGNGIAGVLNGLNGVKVPNGNGILLLNQEVIAVQTDEKSEVDPAVVILGLVLEFARLGQGHEWDQEHEDEQASEAGHSGNKRDYTGFIAV
jgi:hypothetical protein